MSFFSRENFENVKEYIESVFDLDSPYPYDLSPLFESILLKEYTISLYLLEKGVDATLCDEEERSSLYLLSCTFEKEPTSLQIQLFETLLKKGADPLLQTIHLDSVFSVAIRNKNSWLLDVCSKLSCKCYSIQTLLASIESLDKKHIQESIQNRVQCCETGFVPSRNAYFSPFELICWMSTNKMEEMHEFIIMFLPFQVEQPTYYKNTCLFHWLDYYLLFPSFQLFSWIEKLVYTISPTNLLETVLLQRNDHELFLDIMNINELKKLIIPLLPQHSRIFYLASRFFSIKIDVIDMPLVKDPLENWDERFQKRFEVFTRDTPLCKNK